MNEMHNEETVWYVRRAGVVRGPFSVSKIQDYLLLGRVHLADEVGQDGASWSLVSCHEVLIPEWLGLPPTEENQRRLREERMRLDERSAGDRRAGKPEPSAEVLERRVGRERRKGDPPVLVRFRELRVQSEEHPAALPVAGRTMPYGRYIFLLAALMLFLYWVLQS